MPVPPLDPALLALLALTALLAALTLALLALGICMHRRRRREARTLDRALEELRVARQGQERVR